MANLNLRQAVLYASILQVSRAGVTVLVMFVSVNVVFAVGTRIWTHAP